ncbi:MAG: RMD1 family protein [Rhodospirillales bacterium]|nr:RMD1 family protein [Rhodospirillales bacterium]
MAASIFPKSTEIPVRALFIGQQINLKAFDKSQKLATAPFTVRAGTAGCAVIFRYGVIVLFGLDSAEEAIFIRNIEQWIIDPFDHPESEEALIIINSKQAESTDSEEIYLKNTTIERLQLIADILAKNVILSHYESHVSGIFDRIDPFAHDLQKNARINGRKARELLRHTGASLMIQSKMIGRVEVSEKPDLLWDHPELERLYLRLEDEYELTERHNALKHKLELVHQTAETLTGLLGERRTLHVEWYITILIVIEIFLGLGEQFLWGGH